MKKLIISSEKLKPALKKLSQAVSSKSVLPVLSNLYCRVSDNQVELITSDLELTIFYCCPCETEGAPFEMLIPFEFLQKIVAHTGSAPLVIQHPSSRKAKIIGVDDVYELNSLEKVGDFPKLPEVPKKNSITLEGDFIKRLASALQTCGKDEMRPAMTKVCLDITSDSMTIASTDAHSLYTYKIPAESKAADQLLISPKMARAMEGFDKIDLSWHAKSIAVKSDNVLLVATRHEDKYPAYRTVIPNKPANLPVDRNALISALERAALVSSIQSNLFLKKKEGAICIVASDIDYERRSEIEVPGVYAGETQEVAVAPKVMITLLHQITTDYIALHIHGATSAIVITAEEDKNYLGLIMPLVINN